VFICLVSPVTIIRTMAFHRGKFNYHASDFGLVVRDIIIRISHSYSIVIVISPIQMLIFPVNFRVGVPSVLLLCSSKGVILFQFSAAVLSISRYGSKKIGTDEWSHSYLSDCGKHSSSPLLLSNISTWKFPAFQGNKSVSWKFWFSFYIRLLGHYVWKFIIENIFRHYTFYQLHLLKLTGSGLYDQQPLTFRVVELQS
jgi:hypothetical protein